MQRACTLLELVLATLRYLAWVTAWAWSLLSSALGALGPQLLAAAALGMLCFGGAARRGAARRRAASAARRCAEEAAARAEQAAEQARRRSWRSEVDVLALAGELSTLEVGLHALARAWTRERKPHARDGEVAPLEPLECVCEPPAR